MTTEDKALALWNEVRAEREYTYKHTSINREADLAEALCRAIEQHEAFRQEVSDAVVHCRACSDPEVWRRIKFELNRFIIPKSDPLVEVLDSLEWCNTDVLAKDLRAELDAFGLEIREKGQ